MPIRSSRSLRTGLLLALALGLGAALAIQFPGSPEGPLPAPASPPPAPPPPAAGADPAGPDAGRRAAPSRRLPGVVVHGLVQDVTGAAVGEVAVHFNGPGSADFDARSDAAGRFVLEGLAAARYQVRAFGPQLLSFSEFFDLVESETPLQLKLVVDRGLPVRGQVFDEVRQPLAAAVVTPWRQGPAGEELDPACTVRADATGCFELRGSATGYTHVLVEHPGFVPAKARLLPSRFGVVQLQRRR